jgi:Zn-dependent peptidase ImmA (M78 family)
MAGRRALAATDAAQHARVRFGIGVDGPVPDILKVIEETAGVPVTVARLPVGLAGACFVKRGRAFIFVNGSQAVVRQRFTLAHELGHHELGHGSVLDTLEALSNSRDPKEVEANAFAAEFLAPLQAIDNWMRANGRPAVDLESVVRLAAFFGISAQAARYRLEAARFLSRPADRRRLEEEIERGAHLHLARRLRFDEMRDSLDAAQSALPRFPGAMWSNAFAAYESGLISLERMAGMLERDPQEIAAILAEVRSEPAAADPDY